MSAPTLDRNPETTHAGTSAGHRRPRKQLMLVVSALVVLAVAVGTSLAIATRPVATEAPAGAVAPSAAAAEQNANADQGTAARPAQDTPAAAPNGSSGSTGTSGTPGPNASGLALPDGNHDAYVTKVDRASNTIVVDVVQVFHDDQAVREAIADGKSRSEAQYLTTWVRNENPRLRTLPLAGGLVVKLWSSCEEGAGHDPLTTLSANARHKGLYYYTLTLAGGKVQRIQERLAINAC